jgi:hypothetical protein
MKKNWKKKMKKMKENWKRIEIKVQIEKGNKSLKRKGVNKSPNRKREIKVQIEIGKSKWSVKKSNS